MLITPTTNPTFFEWLAQLCRYSSSCPQRKVGKCPFSSKPCTDVQAEDWKAYVERLLSSTPPKAQPEVGLIDRPSPEDEAKTDGGRPLGRPISYTTEFYNSSNELLRTRTYIVEPTQEALQNEAIATPTTHLIRVTENYLRESFIVAHSCVLVPNRVVH